MKFKVDGMMCMHCVKSVTDALNALEGVADVKVELETKTVSLTADDTMKETVYNTIEDLGFDVVE